MPELDDDQKYAVERIQKAFSSGVNQGFILADKMGVVGKTAPAIELIKRAEGIKLIICPTYLLYNWKEELFMWGLSEKDFCVIDTRDQLLEEKPIYLVGYSRISYETFERASGVEAKRPNGIVRQLLNKKYSLIVCDEGHALKSWNSQRSRLILGTLQNKNNHFLNRTENILLLSGTPFLNKIEELYNIVIRIAPKVLDYMTKYQFFQLYAGWIENTGFQIVAHGVKNEEDLKARLKPIMLRRTKGKHLTTKCVEETIRLDPRSATLKKLFADEEKFLKAHGVKPDDVEAITKLKKQDISEIADTRVKIAISKIPAALEMYEDIREEQDEPRPVAIYCYHRATLAALKDMIKRKFPKHRAAFIDGGTSAKDRHDIVRNKFQEGKLDILCATIGALKEGANLTEGRDVIFIELDYVPANLAQAIGRFHRRGQTGTVNVRFLVYDAGVEKRIMTILKEKKTTIDKIIGG